VRWPPRRPLLPDQPGTETAGLSERTIADFGEQWTRFTDNEGFYGSGELLADICGPLLAPAEIRGRRVAEIGSGTGRVVRMLLEAGAAHVVAVEPSAAFEVLCRNVAGDRARAECLRITGDRLPSDLQLDLILSIGVIHHIPDPAPVIRAAHAALRPGGRMLVWLYGREGNGAYLAFTQSMRRLTTRMPHGAVLAVARLLRAALVPYMTLCRTLPLPLAGYLTRVFHRMGPTKQTLIIYDQLRPAYARYYSRSEAMAVLADHGFSDVRLHHRHGYSWTVIGTKS
jgi:SAM-dependent methyltransferase